MLDGGCTRVTDGGPTLNQHWFNVSITGTTFTRTTHCPVLNGCWPEGGATSLNWVSVLCVTCIVVTPHIAKHDALTSVEWMLASAGDSGPALIRNWISVVLTCSGHRYQLEGRGP